MKTSITLAPEYDKALFIRLRRTVESLDGSIHSESWAMAGSVEISMYTITLPDGEVTVVAETYGGLSLEGPKDLVQRIAIAFNESIKKSSGPNKPPDDGGVHA